MEPQKQKALVIQQYGKHPTVEDCDVPVLQDGELLVKMDGTTINPSDRYLVRGRQFNRPLPAVAGIEGSGRVVKVQGQGLDSWIGKRVSLITSRTGTWANYCATNPSLVFEIDDDVPLQCAVSGVVNPLTALCFVEIFKERKLKGIIHTAAASSLGRMLNKLCLKEKIPLLNVVRKQEHVEILKEEGAENILLMNGDWEQKLKEYTSNGFDCLFDAIGGGESTRILLDNMPMKCGIFIYGGLSQQPLVFSHPGRLLLGVKIEGILVGLWWAAANPEVKQRIRSQYSTFLKNQCASKTGKELTFNEFSEGWELSISKTMEGKVLMRPV